MNAHTHVLGGLAAAGLAISFGVSHPLPLALASGLGGLVPDGDHPGSTIGRWVPWPTAWRSRDHSMPAGFAR